MLKTIRQTIRQYKMLSLGDGVVVGLSGGADSVVLLSALLTLRDEMQLSVYAAHINHNLRGDAAMRDEDFVQGLCEDWGVPLLVFQADVKGYAASQKLSIEEAGRNLRYQYLRQGLVEFNAQKIATGHHADDNAETILLNLFRGAGLRGLCGIPPVNGPIIRPLLEVSRESIEAYAKRNNLKYVTDETNESIIYSRNNIRNKIIPAIRELEHSGVGNVAETMTRNALWLRADEEFLAAAAQDVYDELAIPTKISGTIIEITIPIEKLQSHPAALARRVIRHAVSSLRGTQGLEDIQSAHIAAILDIAQGSTGREADLPGFKARREYEHLVLYTLEQSKCSVSCRGVLPSRHKWQNAVVAMFCHPLSPDVSVHIPPLTVTFSLHPPKKYEKLHNCCTQVFNYDNVSNVLELRTRRPGDRITLAGVGTKKLQDYFTDTKTPRSQRDETPLLADGSNILWIMDKHNRTNAAYSPVEGQRTCWVTCKYEQRRDL